MTIQEQWTTISKDPHYLNKAISYWKTVTKDSVNLNKIEINNFCLINRKDITPSDYLVNSINLEKDILKKKALHSIWLKPLNWWSIWTRAFILEKSANGFLVMNVSKLPVALRFKTFNDLKQQYSYNLKYLDKHNISWCIEWVPNNSINVIKSIPESELSMLLAPVDSLLGGLSDDALLGVLRNMSNQVLRPQITAKLNCHLECLAI